MDWWNFAQRGAEKLLDMGFDQLAGHRASVETRIKKLDEAIATLDKAGPQEPAPPPATSLPQAKTASSSAPAQRGKGCVPCTLDHLSTCSGALAEALRFARSDGVDNPEVQSRLTLCVDELNIWERVDAAPEKIVGLSPAEKEFLRRWLPRGRELRHLVNEVESMEGLEETAARVRQYSGEARTEARQLRPPLMAKIEELGEKIEAGQTTSTEAAAEVARWWKSRQAGKGGAHASQ